MRRKISSNTSVILIIIIAAFTLSSYFFDQMAIRKEDKLRNLNIELSSSNLEISDLNSLNNQIEELKYFIYGEFFLKKRYRNYWMKNLIILDKNINETQYLNSQIQKSFDSIFVANSDIKTRMIEYFSDAVTTHNSLNLKIKNIYQFYDKLFPQYFETVDGELHYNFPEIGFEEMFDEIKNRLNSKDLNKYAMLVYDDQKFDDAIENFNFNDWYDVYQYSYALVNNFEFYLKYIEPDINFLDDLIVSKEEYRDNLIAEITKNNSHKNFFILVSIISQISSLLFLLILFRLLIINKK